METSGGPPKFNPKDTLRKTVAAGRNFLTKRGASQNSQQTQMESEQADPAKLEAYIETGIDFIRQGDYRRSINHFINEETRDISSAYIVDSDVSDEEAAKIADILAGKSYPYPLRIGNIDTSLNPKAKIPEQLYHNIALVGAEEWLHRLFDLKGKDTLPGRDIDPNSTHVEEQLLAGYFYDHNVPMTDEFLNRYGRRTWLDKYIKSKNNNFASFLARDL